jgi:DUF4097 and DUF4098 domain-containing protein YvlB
MTRIRQALLVVALLALGSPAAAQDPQWVRDLERQLERHADALARLIERQVSIAQNPRARSAQATESFSDTRRLGRNGTFDLENVAGDIVITGGDGSDVRIGAVKRVRGGSNADRRALLQALQIQVTERGGNIEVRTAYPRRRNAAASVDYTITVPDSANVTLRTTSGTVRVSNLRGELRAESVSGDITASSVERVRGVRTVSGTLSIFGAEGDDVEGSTVSGDVIARDVKMRNVAFTSVSGAMRLTGVESERATLKSMSGDIEYAGPLARSGRYELQSHSGSLRVVPQGDGGFDIDANSFSGNVRSDYQLRVANGGNFRNGLARGLRGTVGQAGAAALVLRSFSGDISVIRK